jgi:hypothetical protein
LSAKPAKWTYRKLEAELLVRVEDVEPSEDGTLVVGRSSSEQSSGSLGVTSELEGGVLPAVLEQGGLNVIVAIDEERFLHNDVVSTY